MIIMKIKMNNDENTVKLTMIIVINSDADDINEI